ncbi:hypothetical protein, partial [Escherichia coli]
GAAAPLTHPVGLPSSLKVKGIASGGLTATALSPFAAGELQGVMFEPQQPIVRLSPTGFQSWLTSKLACVESLLTVRHNGRKYIPRTGA